MQNINQLIDHTILKPDATIDDIEDYASKRKNIIFIPFA